MDITFVSGIGVDPEEFDLYIIPQYIDHYKSLGITDFRIVVNAEDENKTKEGVKLLRKSGVEPYKIWISPYMENERVKILNSIYEKINTKWVITVDGNEFLELTQKELKELLEEMGYKGYELAEAKMIDRIGNKETVKNISIWDQYPFESNLTEEIVKGCNKKVIIFQPDKYHIQLGGHSVINIETRETNHKKVHPNIFRLAHFKWTPTVLKRVKKRYVSYKGKPWVKEIDRTIEYIKSGALDNL